MRLTVVDADWPLVNSVLDDIRRADWDEWFAGTGLPFNVACKLAFQNDPDGYAKAALDESGRPLVFWGATDRQDGGGQAWLFATDSAVPLALSIHRLLKPQLAEMLKRWPRLEAVADSRNTEHHKWLEWLGFVLWDEVPLPPFGLYFKRYTLEP